MISRYLAAIAAAMLFAGVASAAQGEVVGSSPSSGTVATPVDPHQCLRETGSRIPPKDGACINAPGQVYDKREIDSTGAVTAGDALRNLSPSLTVGH